MLAGQSAARKRISAARDADLKLRGFSAVGIFSAGSKDDDIPLLQKAESLNSITSHDLFRPYGGAKQSSSSKMSELEKKVRETEGLSARQEREIVKFVDEFSSMFEQCVSKDQHFRAALFERWQMFEMEYEGQPAGIVKAARLMLMDARFNRVLEKQIKDQKDALRDAAGIVFRLYGLWKSGDLEVDLVLPRGNDTGETTRGPNNNMGRLFARDAPEYVLLEQAVNAVISPLENASPANWDGAFVGSLYMQVLTKRKKRP